VKGWALLWDFLKEKPLIGLFVTMAHFLIRPLRFTDETVREDWKNKMSPPRFLVESYVLLLVVILASPFGTLSGESNLATIPKAFEECMDVTCVLLAFFAGCFVAHLILNQARMSFIRAFFLFCYLQGFLWIIVAFFLIALSVVAGKYMNVDWNPPFITFTDESHQRRAAVVVIIALSLEAAVVGYVWSSIIRAYRPRWYRFLGAFLAFFLSTAAFSYVLGYCVGYISARLLSNK
jgi:hypothetical protein